MPQNANHAQMKKVLRDSLKVGILDFRNNRLDEQVKNKEVYIYDYDLLMAILEGKIIDVSSEVSHDMVIEVEPE